MPKFKFDGIPVGSYVSLTASQAGMSASGEVDYWGASLGSLDIAMSHGGELVAPAGLWFDAVNVAGFDVLEAIDPADYDPSFHDITYIWDFGDPGGFDVPLNMPDAWNDRNVAYGKRAAHVFRAPGTYAVSVWAISKAGITGSASITVTIADADALYTGARTIAYAGDGDFSWAPGGAVQVTNDAALIAAVNQMPQTGRILFRDGSDQTIRLNPQGAADRNLRFQAWPGTGPMPVLRPNRGDDILLMHPACPVRDVVFDGLDLRGPWDAATETGDPSTHPWNIKTYGAANFFVVSHNCRFSGFDLIPTSTLDGIPFTMIFSECLTTNWQDMGFFGNVQGGGADQGYPDVHAGSRVAWIGCDTYQDPDACKGSLGKKSVGNAHGPIRVETTAQVVIRSSSFFSNNSWGVGAQPCLRMFQNNPGFCSAVIDRVACEGGDSMAGFDMANGGKEENPGNFLIDKMLCVGTTFTKRGINVAMGGTTVRNLYHYMPNVVHGLNAKLESILNAGVDFPANTANVSRPVQVHNVTALSDYSGNDLDAFFFNFALFETFTIENNVQVAPTQTTPLTADGPLDTTGTITGFAPRSKGIRWSISKPEFALASELPQGGSVTVAYPTTRDNVTNANPPGDPTAAADYVANGRHLINGKSMQLFEDGDFAVDFGADAITVTNTSGAPWPAGTYHCSFAYGHVTDTLYATPVTDVPLPRPASGSPALDGGDAGAGAHDDFLGTVRPQSGDEAGAFLAP